MRIIPLKDVLKDIEGRRSFFGDDSVVRFLRDRPGDVALINEHEGTLSEPLPVGDDLLISRYMASDVALLTTGPLPNESVASILEALATDERTAVEIKVQRYVTDYYSALYYYTKAGVQKLDVMGGGEAVVLFTDPPKGLPMFKRLGNGLYTVGTLADLVAA